MRIPLVQPSRGAAGGPLHPDVQGRLKLVAEGMVGAPAVSGDGATLVWNQMVDGNLEIMRYRDCKTEQITHNDVPDMHPTVSDDGNVIAWTRKGPDGNWDVWQWRDGQESVVSAGPGNEMSPHVSGDGRVIAFDDDNDGKWARWDIKKWENGAVEAVTSAPGVQEFPVVNQDGSKIFWRDYTKDSDIWMRDQRGTIKPVVATPSHQGPFAITPDGNTVVWADSTEGETDLLIRRGARTEAIANVKDVDESNPTISADGRTVAWTNMDFRKGAPADTQIYVRSDDKTQQITMSSDGLNVLPSLSGDGTKLAWLWIDQENTDHRRIYVLDR